MQIKAGLESVTAGRFYAYTVATGVAVTITAATAGLSLWYKRAGGAKVVLESINDLATEDAAYKAQGVKVIGGPIHRVDLPNAAYAAGATQVEIGGEATGIEIVGQTIDLIGQATTAATTDSAQTAASAAITAATLPTASQIDTQLSNTHGAGAWGAAAGGDFTQTVTVKTVGAVEIQNATVYIMDGATIVDKQTTAATGIALPSADAGTYTLKVVKDGYTTNSASITVTAAAARAVTLTALSFTPPSDEDQVTAWGYVYTQACVVEPNATVYIEQVTAGARNIYDSARRTLTANASGLVSGAVWADGSEYRMSRDGINWSDDFEPSDDGDVDLPTSYRLPGLMGTS